MTNDNDDNDVVVDDDGVDDGERDDDGNAGGSDGQYCVVAVCNEAAADVGVAVEVDGGVGVIVLHYSTGMVA